MSANAYTAKALPHTAVSIFMQDQLTRNLEDDKNLEVRLATAPWYEYL